MLAKKLLSIWFWIWFGIVVGVSFMATPVKFQATQLDLPVALEVGKVTFQLLAKSERILALGLVAALIFKPKPIVIALVALMAAVLLVQQFWLMPALYERVDMVIAGQDLPKSSIHFIYIFVEVFKLIILAGLGLTVSCERCNKTS
ncbi:MAG: hypothetical protein ACK5LE_08085 [Alphaproteobacteria bacterium]